MGNPGFVEGTAAAFQSGMGQFLGCKIEDFINAFSESRLPGYVDSVELKLEAGEIHVRLGHTDVIDWTCPECGEACKLCDHQPERQWRHLDTCQYQTILHVEPPRSE